MTSLRDALIADWQPGNLAALQILFEAVPADLSPSAMRRYRDRSIRLMARPLLRRYSRQRVAAMLHESGAAAESGRVPDLGEIDPALVTEVAAIRREAQRMLAW